MTSVTVIVAAKNKAATMEACLKSILALDYPVQRVLVLDGYSTDGTFEVLQRYADRVEVHQLDVNLSATFNWALDRTDTEYVAFTDADCVVDRAWLTELLKPFADNREIVATAGYCGTPESLSTLQTMIGLELESRFKRFPRYLTRAPTMNLCVKTDMARRVKFDEKQMVAVETDFGYRLTVLGKMAYTPEARVWHYHRASWRAYFRQQRDQARWATRLVGKHGNKALGDHISTRGMIAQIPLLALALATLPLSLVDWRLLAIPVALVLTLLAIYIHTVSRLVPLGPRYLAFFALFAWRNVAWATGVAQGLSSHALGAAAALIKGPASRRGRAQPPAAVPGRQAKHEGETKG